MVRKILLKNALEKCGKKKHKTLSFFLNGHFFEKLNQRFSTGSEFVLQGNL